MKNFTRKFIGLLTIMFTLGISQSFAQLSLHINTSSNEVYFNNTTGYNMPIYDFNLVSSTPWSVTTTTGVVFSNFGCSNETFGDGTSAYMCTTHGGTWDPNANGLITPNGEPLYAGGSLGGGISNNYISIDYSSSDQANGLPVEGNVNVISGEGGSSTVVPGNDHIADMAPQTIEYIYAEADRGNGMTSIPVYINGQLLEQDCAGTWGGSLVNDGCGVCDGDNSSCSGCVSGWATNYDPNSIIDDGSCVLSGCTDQTALNYNENATDDDESCMAVILGCMDAAAVNYDANANTDNAMCQPYTLADVVAAVAAAEAAAAIQVAESYAEGAASVTPEDGIGQADVEASYAEGVAYGSPVLIDATLDLPAGWGMFGYTCINPVDAMVGLSSISDKIELVKDALGNAYVPEYGFNGLGTLQFAKGYQIKMIEEVSSFHFCQTHTLKVFGCIDETAFNYSPVANTDDGTCIGVVAGCIDASALNYSSEVNVDDGSCFPIIEGCMDEYADNYAAQTGNNLVDINTEDNSQCNYLGCIDEAAFNFDLLATEDDGSCIASIFGCIDVAALNFNPDANTNDDSCEYPSSDVTISIVPGTYPTEISWNIKNCNGDVLALGDAYFDATISLPSSYIIYMYDSYGDGWNGGALNINESSYTFIVGSEAIELIGGCSGAGCNDILAENYNSSATVDDGSCEYNIYSQCAQILQYNPGMPISMLEECQPVAEECNFGNSVACDILCEGLVDGYSDFGSCGCGSVYSVNQNCPDFAVVENASGAGTYNYEQSEIYFIHSYGAGVSYDIVAPNAENITLIVQSGSDIIFNIYYDGLVPVVNLNLEAGSGIFNLIEQ